MPPVVSRLPGQLVVGHLRQKRNQLGGMVHVELSAGRAEKETCQYRLANIHRVKLAPQGRIGVPSSYGNSDGRFELPNKLCRRVRISFLDATHKFIKIRFHRW
jgi:hypothetical protein